MDKINKQIIHILQKNARISMKELAEKVHMAAPSVIERVRKLEESGFIEGYSTTVSLKKMNREITAMVLFKSKDCHGLYKFCKEHPDVLECYRVAGEVSYIAKIATHSVEDLEKFIDASMAFGTPSTNLILSSSKKETIEYHEVNE
ncbi:Lrp/AsnC family transcriptional regulator [Enterococcus saccharolyticus]|uniref:AsnC family transcriptional regulator n=1 Tax=Candidatus Enterococcus willemsii TaxID=1857215 RepID=A0ABQ6Z1L8_9ENTE|nr:MULTISPECIES: Lrp/AsnC family transcriptional regulator [Enterococcus]KAF1305031.1 AsnC family transcriptional regulator [Enterococcus sp. CU12B]MCD5003672.1 Lrp/AsnC family transcriptional regulator [Enterococcus saccharolyticus]